MKSIGLAMALLLGAVASSSTIDPHRMDMTQAMQSAKSRSDREALARDYEDVAQEMRSEAEEHKKLLAQYQAKKISNESKLKISSTIARV